MFMPVRADIGMTLRPSLDSTIVTMVSASRGFTRSILFSAITSGCLVAFNSLNRSTSTWRTPVVASISSKFKSARWIASRATSARVGCAASPKPGVSTSSNGPTRRWMFVRVVPGMAETFETDLPIR